MLRFEFTNEELNKIKSKIHFTKREERIIDYRMDEKTIVEMSQLEHCDVSTINRDIKKIRKKIAKVV